MDVRHSDINMQINTGILCVERARDSRLNKSDRIGWLTMGFMHVCQGAGFSTEMLYHDYKNLIRQALNEILEGDNISEALENVPICESGVPADDFPRIDLSLILKSVATNMSKRKGQ